MKVKIGYILYFDHINPDNSIVEMTIGKYGKLADSLNPTLVHKTKIGAEREIKYSKINEQYDNINIREYYREI